MFNGTTNYTASDLASYNINYSGIISIIRITLVLLSRAGFILIQSGSIPTEDSYNLILQNIVEFAVSTGSYGLFGVLLSFGKQSYNGLVGYGSWDYTQMDSERIIFGFGVTVIGSAIVTTFLAGRLHFIGYVLVAFVYAGFSQPIIMHWIWHDKGWMNNVRFLKTASKVRDHAGALPVHVSSGFVGIIGMFFLGRRLLKLEDIDEASLGSESPNTITLGYLLLANGLIGLSLPYNSIEVNREDQLISVILINSVLSLSGGIAASVIAEFVFRREILNYWVLLRLLQSGIAGLVLLSSFIADCRPPIPFAITFVGGILVNFMSKCIYATALEDYCNLIPVHFYCGIFSVVLQPFLTKSNGRTLIAFLWQITSVAVIISSVLALFLPLFSILYWSGFLRNRHEENDHNRSLRVIRGTRECPLARLFVLRKHDDILEPGLSGKSTHSARSQVDVVHELVRKDTQGTEVGTSSLKSKHKIRRSESSMKDIRRSHLRKAILKRKTIYTVPKISANDKNILLKEEPFCSGDAINDANVYKLDDLIANRSEHVTVEDMKKGWVSIKPRVRKNKSHIKLSKSKRYVDFSKRKRLTKTGKSKNALVNVYINRSSELIAYDKKYNDGIITYKVPRFIEYISD